MMVKTQILTFWVGALVGFAVGCEQTDSLKIDMRTKVPINSNAASMQNSITLPFAGAFL